VQVAPVVAVAKERLLAQLNEANREAVTRSAVSIDGLDFIAGKQSIDTAFTFKYDDPNLSLAAGVAGHIARVVESARNRGKASGLSTLWRAVPARYEYKRISVRLHQRR
jgi:hypothetical protein